MKLNRKWFLVIALVMSLTMATAGTLAYLTDRDSEANVFTVGNVKIDLKEDFQQGATLIPGVNIDKKPVVENIGNNDAWVWAEIAIPSELNSTATASKNVIHFNMSADSVADGKWNWWDDADYSEGAYFIRNEEIDGIEYDVYVVQYETALKPGDVTEEVIYKVYLDPHVDIDPDGNWAWVEGGVVTPINWNSNTNGGPVIYVSAYAMQTAGFDSVYAAYDAYQTQWGNNGTELGTAAELINNADEAYDASLKSGVYTLATDYKTSDSAKHFSGNREYAIKDGVDYTLNLNGHTITHDGTYQDGKNTGYTYLYTTAYSGKLTINGEGKIKSENTEGNVCIVYAQGPSEVVINGGDFETTRGIAIWAGKNGKVTINGGSFISHKSAGNEELIYSSGGIIDIYGGFFHNEQWENRPVNVANANRDTGFINIYGGTFVNFDPSTGGDDPSNIRVMDGYKVVSETQANGDVWYTVVKK